MSLDSEPLDFRIGPRYRTCPALSCRSYMRVMERVTLTKIQDLFDDI